MEIGFEHKRINDIWLIWLGKTRFSHKRQHNRQLTEGARTLPIRAPPWQKPRAVFRTDVGNNSVVYKWSTFQFGSKAEVINMVRAAICKFFLSLQFSPQNKKNHRFSIANFPSRDEKYYWQMINEKLTRAPILKAGTINMRTKIMFAANATPVESRRIDLRRKNLPQIKGIKARIDFSKPSANKFEYRSPGKIEELK